jgi:predicted GNAT family N-acyltransferase
MSIRHVQLEDGPVLRDFLASLPEEDVSFLKVDVTDARVIEEWLQSDRTIRLLDVDDDGHITACASIIPGIGRSDHVAELRLVVDVRRRRSGIGRAMAEYAVLAAVRAGFRKITVDVGSTQDQVQQLFASLGFVPEALQLDQIRADDGQLMDILVLAHRVDENWNTMATLGQAGAS